MYEQTSFHRTIVLISVVGFFRLLNRSIPVYPHFAFLQRAAKADPPVAAKPAFPVVPIPAAPSDWKRATRLPVPTPPSLKMAVVDISHEARLPAVIPAVVKPAAAMAKGAATTVVTAPAAPRAASSAAEPADRHYFKNKYSHHQSPISNISSATEICYLAALGFVTLLSSPLFRLYKSL